MKLFLMQWGSETENGKLSGDYLKIIIISRELCRHSSSSSKYFESGILFKSKEWYIQITLPHLKYKNSYEIIFSLNSCLKLVIIALL